MKSNDCVRLPNGAYDGHRGARGTESTSRDFANAELLREVLSDPMDQDCVDVILAEVDRLSNLVTDLMLYTREREPTIAPMDLTVLGSADCRILPRRR